jgi:hypothetical protein
MSWELVAQIIVIMLFATLLLATLIERWKEPRDRP